MKKTLSYFIITILCFALILCFTFRKEIITFVLKEAIQNKEVTLPSEVSGFNNYEFMFVQDTNDFHVKKRQDILNVIYTVLNHGIDEFTFYCDKDYTNCSKEFDEISNDQILLSTINNLVSPYNSYEKIYFKITSYGEINMKIDKLYSDDEIRQIESKIAEFESNLTVTSDTDKIKAFHDYLINNSVYDKDRAEAIEQGTDEGNSVSHKANGPLLNGIALCSGYSDAMKIYLDKLGLPNYKISTNNHIWNLVKINSAWKHLDLTWDDPVTSDGSNILLHKFFLISTDELLKLDKTGHNFNIEYYPELKTS